MLLRRDWLQHAVTPLRLALLCGITTHHSIFALAWGPMFEGTFLAILKVGFVLDGRLARESRSAWLDLLAAVVSSMARSFLVWSCTQLPFGASMALHLINVPADAVVQMCLGNHASIRQTLSSPHGFLAGLQTVFIFQGMIFIGRLNRRSWLFGMAALAFGITGKILESMAARTTPTGKTASTGGPAWQRWLQPRVVPLVAVAASLGTTFGMNYSGLHRDRLTRRDLVWSIAYGLAASAAGAIEMLRDGQARGHEELPQDADLDLRQTRGTKTPPNYRTVLPASVALVLGAHAVLHYRGAGALGYSGSASIFGGYAALAVLAFDYLAYVYLEADSEDSEKPSVAVERPVHPLASWGYKALVGFLVLESAAIAWAQSPFDREVPSWLARPAQRTPEWLHVPQAEIILAHYNEPEAVVRHTVAGLQAAVSAYRDVRTTIYSKGFQDYGWATQREAKLDKLRRTGADRVVTLPNYGREGATYLDYIIEHYDALPSLMLFSQADPDFDWVYWDRLKLIDPDVGFLSLGQYLSIHDGWDSHGNGHYPQVQNVWELFHSPLDDPYNPDADILITYGGQFVVSRTRLLAHPKVAYERLKQILVSRPGEPDHVGGFGYKDQAEGPVNPFFGHVLERSWPLIFNRTDTTPAKAYKDGDGSDWHAVCYDLPSAGK